MAALAKSKWLLGATVQYYYGYPGIAAVVLILCQKQQWCTHSLSAADILRDSIFFGHNKPVPHTHEKKEQLDYFSILE